MAISEATKEAMYLREIFNNAGLGIECVIIFNDNQGAIKFAENSNFHARTKHIDVRHHFIREVRDSGILKLKYLPTDKMPADVLTKSLGGTKHRECLKNLGMSYVYAE